MSIVSEVDLKQQEGQLRYVNILESFAIFHAIYTQLHPRQVLSHLQHAMELRRLMFEGKAVMDIIEYDDVAHKYYIRLNGVAWILNDFGVHGQLVNIASRKTYREQKDDKEHQFPRSAHGGGAPRGHGRGHGGCGGGAKPQRPTRPAHVLTAKLCFAWNAA